MGAALGCGGGSASKVAPSGAEGDGKDPRGAFGYRAGQVGGGTSSSMTRSFMRMPAHMVASGTSPLAQRMSRVSRRMSAAKSRSSSRKSQVDTGPRIPAEFELSKLTENQLQRVKAAFARFDRDESGQIGVSEMRQARPVPRCPAVAGA